ncbi:hypothetical protein AUK22_06755 [bacterium CG2_30_54_10]|nr:MAG: hypothetical protein AUK22_06755 [bacterium CG2_30_54_10]
MRFSPPGSAIGLFFAVFPAFAAFAAFAAFGVFAVFAVFAVPAPAMAQDDTDVTDFLDNGKKAYEKGDLMGASIEFENVLLIDSRNFDAKIWLVQVYADLKQTDKARKLLSEVQRQAPGHARVQSLAKLLGTEAQPPGKKEGDLVVYETLTLLGSGTRLREYGLVVPEGKVAQPEIPKPGDKDQDFSSIDNLGKPSVEATSGAQLEKLIGNEGPLREVFDLWASAGLNEALEKYFEIALKDRSLAALDDRGLLRKGMEFFQPKVDANAKDPEARYFLGVIFFLSGLLDDSQKTLEPLRTGENAYQEKLRAVFAELDRKEAENQARQAALKREREAEEAAARAEQARQEAASIAANLSGGATGTSSVPLKPSEVLHNEGYEMYKKGLLDQAVEKFQTAINLNDKEPKYFYHMGLALTDKGLAGHVDSFDRAMEVFNKVIALDPGGKLAKDSEVMIRDIVAAKKSLKN